MKRLASQAGSFTLLLGLFLIPLLMLFLCYSLELVRLNTQRAEAQQVIDQASIMATKKLPYQEEARKTALSVLSKNNMLHGTSVLVNSDSVQISYSTKIKSLITSATTNNTYRINSSTAINSKNIVLFLDASSYLAPSISNDVNDSWTETTAEKKSRLKQEAPKNSTPEDEEIANTKTNWPYAQFFKKELKRNYQGRKVPAKILTQQCFNPAFSALKEAVIRLYDYTSAHQHNAVGLLFGPGNIGSVQTIKNPSSTFSSSNSPGEGRFDYFREQYNADEFCLSAMQYENKHKGYNLPKRSVALPQTPYQSVNFPLVNSKHRLPANNLQYLTVRDIIWSLAVRRNYESNLQIVKYVDFRNVLEQVANLALTAKHQASRAGLNHALSTSAFLFMGDLPWINNQRIRGYPSNVTRKEIFSIPTHLRVLHKNRKNLVDLLARKVNQLNQKMANAKRQLQIYITFTRHLGNYPPELYPFCTDISDDSALKTCAEFIQDGEAFEKMLNNFKEQNIYSEENVLIKILRTPDIESMASSLPAWLPLIDRTTLRGS